MANPRVYSIFHVKSVNEDQRIITGIATTPETDRMGDIVEPRGAQFKLPIPLLWQHNSDQPIGEVTAARVTDAGIEVTAKFAQIDEPGALHDRLTEAWQSVKAGLVKGLSIGFQSIESTRIEGTYGMRFVKWLWLELSCVTIPANADASILAIKSAASGTAPRDHQPGVSGGTRVVSMRTDTPHMKSYADQIKTWENTRAAKAARQDEIQQKALGEGRAKDEAEKQEFDTLTSELKSIDAELVDLHALETREAQAAVVVEGHDRARRPPGPHRRPHHGLPRTAEGLPVRPLCDVHGAPRAASLAKRCGSRRSTTRTIRACWRSSRRRPSPAARPPGRTTSTTWCRTT
jgi:HK97 family phage prohead protease